MVNCFGRGVLSTVQRNDGVVWGGRYTICQEVATLKNRVVAIASRGHAKTCTVGKGLCGGRGLLLWGSLASLIRLLIIGSSQVLLSISNQHFSSTTVTTHKK